jgi:hypothetical protein
VAIDEDDSVMAIVVVDDGDGDGDSSVFVSDMQ